MEILNLPSKDQSSAKESKIKRSKSYSPAFELEDLYVILQNHPNDSVSAMKLVRLLEKRGRLDEALKILKSIVKIDSSFQTVSALGLLEYRMEKDGSALRHLQDALQIAPDEHPELFDIFKALGNIYVRRGEYELAEDNYHKAFRIHADSDVLLVNLGTLAIQRAHWDLAVERFRSALAMNIQNDKAWVGLAIGHKMKGDFELAWGNLEAALQYNPLNEVALTLALDWGPSEGRENRVLELLRQFLLSGGWNEKFSLAFVGLSWRRGERELAQLELERLLAVNPGHEMALKMAAEMRESA